MNTKIEALARFLSDRGAAKLGIDISSPVGLIYKDAATDILTFLAQLEAQSTSEIVAVDSVNDERTQMLRDILAIQDACGLHTDEYAPGSVIEYIKELEATQLEAPA